MSFDALTLAAVRDELEPLLSDGRIQKVVFLDELSLALEIFKPGVGRTVLLLSAQPERDRVLRVSALPTRGLERDTPFSLLARKHLRNARVHSIRQPRLERVLELGCEQRDASGQHYEVVLIVEVMGRRSNLILVDTDGAILDAARRSPPSRNPRRPVLPHQRYAYPPPQSRTDPSFLHGKDLADAAQIQAGSLAKLLANTVAGLSPQAARELAYRATGSVEGAVASADWDAIVAATRAFFAPVDTHQWAPTLALEEGAPIAFAPYRLTHLESAGADLRDAATISGAIETFDAAAERDEGTGRTKPRGDALAAERRALLEPLDRAAHALERRISALEHQLESGQSQREPLRAAGDLLLTRQTEVPAEATEFEGIELDPKLSAVENAQAYFARYRKAREAAERVPELLAAARNDLAHLSDLRALVEVAESMDAMRALRREAAAATGSARAPSGKKGKPEPKRAPYRRVPLDGSWEALIGTSAEGNATVTFDLASADDLWLHARGMPGAHVILRGQAEPPDAVIARAAGLAAAHSTARASGNVEVDVTKRRYVKKIPNAPPGLVRYTNERTLRVSPGAA